MLYSANSVSTRTQFTEDLESGSQKCSLNNQLTDPLLICSKFKCVRSIFHTNLRTDPAFC